MDARWDYLRLVETRRDSSRIVTNRHAFLPMGFARRAYFSELDPRFFPSVIIQFVSDSKVASDSVTNPESLTSCERVSVLARLPHALGGSFPFPSSFLGLFCRYVGELAAVREVLVVPPRCAAHSRPSRSSSFSSPSRSIVLNFGKRPFFLTGPSKRRRGYDSYSTLPVTARDPSSAS